MSAKQTYWRKIMKMWLFFLTGLLFFSCTLTNSTPRYSETTSKDELFRKKIIGKWAEGESPYGIASFEDGGIYNAWLYEDSTKKRLLHSIKGKWWIEKGKLYNEANEITPPIPDLKTGGVVTDEIVDISDDLMTLIDKAGLRYTNKKVME
jgi:hypothetical protein